MIKGIRLQSVARILVAVCILASTTLTEVEAARAGSGRVVGTSRWRQTTPSSRPMGGQQRAATPPQSPQPQPAVAPRPAAPVAPVGGGRSWLGPLAGLAAGFGLAHLLGSSTPAMADGGAASHGGFSWFWILLLCAGGWWLWKRRSAAMASEGSSAVNMNNDSGSWTHSTSTDSAFSNVRHNVSFMNEPQHASIGGTPSPGAVLPDQEAFLHAARQYFTSLQAAFDKGDLEPFRDWMVPELQADLSAQIHERGNAFNQTDVVTLSAQVIDEKAEADANWVTVKFYGTTREHPNPEPQPFNEAWHFKQCRRTSNDPWKLAGIEPLEG